MNGHRIDLERLVQARVERVWEVMAKDLQDIAARAERP